MSDYRCDEELELEAEYSRQQSRLWKVKVKDLTIRELWLALRWLKYRTPRFGDELQKAVDRCK